MSRSRVERLRKEHERKMITRIIFFISLIILMLVLLVWYAVPAFVSIANIWLQVKELDKVTSSNRTVVLTEPSLEKASRELSKESKTSIKGSTDSGSRVYLMVNEQANGDVIADGDGFFEFNDVALKEGENLVYVYRKDERGNKSNPSRSVTIVVDTQAPSIEVSKPFSGESFTGQSRRTIDVEGTASGADFVFVNDSRVILDEDGKFSHRVRLESGENLIVVKAIDDAGNESVEVKRTVRWSE